MRPIVSIRRAGAVGLLLVIGAGVAFGESETSSPVKAVLEARGRQFFYAGDPFSLKISIGNDGTETLSNPVRNGLLQGFEVRGTDGVIRPTGKADVPEPARPEKLSPKAGYFLVVDLTKLYPELLRPGQYSIRWSSGEIASEVIAVRMIPKYDAAKEYLARVETDSGTFSIGLFPRTAPVAVKSFIDMCNAGYYDGLTFHKIVPDLLVEGGDGAGDGSGRPPFTYPAELANTPVVAGTVLMKPASPSPPANGSQFVILLRPEPSWTGQSTVLGQVIDGLEVVRKISRLPSTQQAQKPHYRPLQDVRIVKIAVQEKAPPAAGGGV